MTFISKLKQNKMKKILLFGTLIGVLFSSCGTSPRGELVGVQDLEEFYPAQKATTTKSGEYGAKDYKKATTTRGRTGFGDKGGSLNEVKRMQKLANIIK